MGRKLLRAGASDKPETRLFPPVMAGQESDDAERKRKRKAEKLKG